MKSQSLPSYFPLDVSSHSHISSNLRLRTMMLWVLLMLKVQCRMVAPLAEKIVRPPFLYLMSSLLTPVEVIHDLNHPDAAGLVERDHRVGELQRVGDFRVSRIGLGNHAAADGRLAETHEIELRIGNDGRVDREHGE